MPEALSEMFKNPCSFVHDRVINSAYSNSVTRADRLQNNLSCWKVRIMFRPEEEKPVNLNPQGEQTDRVNGEYHYRNGYTQRIYSDAHYVRADESTTPPRYYTPPERPVHEARRQSKKKSVGLGALLAICRSCAILGGLCGSAVTGVMLERRIAPLEKSVEEISESISQPLFKENASVPAPPAEMSAVSYGTLSAGDIYDLACEQVVGISTSVTYTNFFGMPVSAAVSGSGFIITADGYTPSR